MLEASEDRDWGGVCRFRESLGNGVKMVNGLMGPVAFEFFEGLLYACL